MNILRILRTGMVPSRFWEALHNSGGTFIAELRGRMEMLGQVDGWTDGSIDGEMYGWIDGWMHGYNIYIYIYSGVYTCGWRSGSKRRMDGWTADLRFDGRTWIDGAWVPVLLMNRLLNNAVAWSWLLTSIRAAAAWSRTKNETKRNNYNAGGGTLP